MCLSLLNKILQIAIARIRPADQLESRTISVGNGAFCKLGISDKPTLIDPTLSSFFSKFTNVLHARINIKRNLKIALEPKLIVELNFSDDALVSGSGYHIYLVLNTYAREHLPRRHGKATCAENLSDVILKGKTGRTESEYRTFERIACSY